MRTAIANIIYRLNYECLKTVILVFSEFPKVFFSSIVAELFETSRTIQNESRRILIESEKYSSTQEICSETVEHS